MGAPDYTDKATRHRDGQKWTGSFVVFLVGVGLFFPAFLEDYWVYVDPVEGTQDVDRISLGIWTECNNTIYQCEGYNGEYLEACQVFLVLSIVCMSVAGVLYMMPFVAALGQISAGVCAVVGVAVYGVETSHYDVGWCLGLASSGGAIFAINGVVLFIMLGINECKRTLRNRKDIGLECRAACCTCTNPCATTSSMDTDVVAKESEDGIADLSYKPHEESKL